MKHPWYRCASKTRDMYGLRGSRPRRITWNGRSILIKMASEALKLQAIKPAVYGWNRKPTLLSVLLENLFEDRGNASVFWDIRISISIMQNESSSHLPRWGGDRSSFHTVDGGRGRYGREKGLVRRDDRSILEERGNRWWAVTRLLLWEGILIVLISIGWMIRLGLRANEDSSSFAGGGLSGTWVSRWRRITLLYTF